MSNANPAPHDLEQLKKLAKGLLKAANSGDPEAIGRFAKLDLPEDGKTGYKLANAQWVIARENGFESWQQLRDHIESLSSEDFFKAIAKGVTRKARTLIKEFPSLRGKKNEERNMRPLPYAAYHGHLDIVKELIEAGENPTQGEWQGPRPQTSALYYAKQQGHQEIVDYLYAWLYEKRRYSEKGQELCNAIADGDIDKATSLLDSDSSLANATEFGDSSANDGGEPVLVHAIKHNSPEAVKLLLSHGADLNAKTVGKTSIIKYAIEASCAKGYRPGLDRKPDPEKRHEIVQLILDAGVERDIWIECALGNFEAVERIVKEDPEAAKRPVKDPDTKRWGQDSYPLSAAAKGNHIKIARYLLERGADPDTPHSFKGEHGPHTDKGAPMEAAVGNENMDMAKLLFEFGASPNTSRYACGNAMNSALGKSNDELLDLLLSKGGILGYDEKFEYEWTNQKNILLQAAYLQMPGTPPDLPIRFLLQAAFSGSSPLAELSLSKLDTVPEKLHYEILKRAASMWSVYIGNSEKATAKDYLDLLALLLDNGIDANAANEQGETCLHFTARDFRYPSEEERVEQAKILLERGADPSLKEANLSLTPAEFARNHGYEKLEAVLRNGS